MSFYEIEFFFTSVSFEMKTLSVLLHFTAHDQEQHKRIIAILVPESSRVVRSGFLKFLKRSVYMTEIFFPSSKKKKVRNKLHVRSTAYNAI